MSGSCVTMTTVMPCSRLSPVTNSHDLGAALGVEIAGRLVGEEHRRPRDDGARDGDALLLAAGQLGRRVPLAALEADLGERRQRQLAAARPPPCRDR